MAGGVSGGSRLVAVLLTLSCVAAVAPAATGAASALHRIRIQRTLRLPAPGHVNNVLGRTRIPRRLPGYYLYMQVARADGRTLPRVGQGRVLVLTGSGRKPLVKLILSSRYNPHTGLLRYAVTVRNVGVRHYRSRRARLKAAITVGYRR